MNATTGEKWFTDRMEVARGPMKAFTEPGVRTITVMCATQMMKTELILNAIGQIVHQDPAPILVVQPKEELAKKFSHVRLKQMIKSTPAIRELFGEDKSRDSSNTALYKEFKGGQVVMVSSKAPSNLAMLAIRYVFLDEIDKYDESSGEEGDPVDLAEERMSKYTNNSLSIRVCSPTIKDNSRIEASYNESDQRKPFVSCPHCNHKQILTWKHVHWNKDEDGHGIPETGRIHCESCGAEWSEHQRLQSIKKLIWRQTAKFQCNHCSHSNDPSAWDSNADDKWQLENGVYRAICEECGKGKCPNKHAGFWASKLYGQFRAIPELVDRWIKAQGNIERLKMFINTQLAQTFETPGEQIKDIEWLTKRKEQFSAEVPDGVGLITAGVDVQDNRLEIEVVGWGMNEESWSIDHHVIDGDPKSPETWLLLDNYLRRKWTYNNGSYTYIAAACIDMQGHHTQQVLNYTKHRVQRRIWPVRGVGGDGKAHPVWPLRESRNKSQIPFFNIGVDSAKNTIFGRLFIEQFGPGYMHYPADRHDDWFKQLTAEKRVTKYRGAVKYLVWDNPKHARNEAFDCRVYAYAALCGLQQKGWDLNQFVISKKLILLSEKNKAELGKGETSLTKAKSQIRSPRPVVKSKFMNQ